MRERYRDIRDLRRKESAAEVVAGLDLDGREIFCLTRWQFSLVDIIEAILHRTGPANLEISTWTAASTDVSQALAMIAAGRDHLAREGTPDTDALRGFVLLAHRELYRRMLEVGDFDGARKVLKDIAATARL